jgi:hypothetical protein
MLRKNTNYCTIKIFREAKKEKINKKYRYQTNFHHKFATIFYFYVYGSVWIRHTGTGTIALLSTGIASPEPSSNASNLMVNKPVGRFVKMC